MKKTRPTGAAASPTKPAKKKATRPVTRQAAASTATTKIAARHAILTPDTQGMFVPNLNKPKTGATVTRKPKRKSYSIFTFASRLGKERTVDLARSLPAYFRYKLISGNG